MRQQRLNRLVALLVVSLGVVLAANPTILADGTAKYLPGSPAAGYQSGGTWYAGLTDQHGSLLGTVSEAGTLSALSHYDPYGAPLAGSPAPTGIGYTGEWTDATGLLNLRARSYDPALGRFIGRDTFAGVASAPQTGNRYAFGTGNPLLAVDPSGHFNNHLVMPVRAFVSLGVSFTGPAGLGYVALTGILGYDPIAGVSLTPEQRALALAPVAVGAIAVVGAQLAKAVPRLISATLGRADEALSVARAAAGRAVGLARSALTRLGRADEMLSAFGSRVGRALDRGGEALQATWANRARYLGNEFGQMRDRAMETASARSAGMTESGRLPLTVEDHPPALGSRGRLEDRRTQQRRARPA